MEASESTAARGGVFTTVIRLVHSGFADITRPKGEVQELGA